MQELAEKLHLSANYLSDLRRTRTKLSARQHIQQQVLVQAKLLKLLLALGLVGFGAPAAFAQLPAAANAGELPATASVFRAGLKGGYNLDGLRGETTRINRQDRHDVHAGLCGQVQLTHFSAIQAEVLYSRLGFTGTPSPSASPESYRLDYLTVPLLYVGRVSNTCRVQTGAQAGVLLRAGRDGESLARRTAGFTGMDYGAVLGVEAQRGPVRVGVRQTLSLGKLFTNAAGPGSVAAHFQHAELCHFLFRLRPDALRTSAGQTVVGEELVPPVHH
ncbi:PorT family protein [Hymenobacter gummosus]|uniref:PorT family protein n=1 Tax=Hymenobacter gummosus TaxID=1776032 RepID=A0A431U7M0_9BACT|nr:outer membrane beta-barrel protein [Hymenobacter gummosus]RTQ53274.1 PorT family protein [Hymenobacter gummosus]